MDLESTILSDEDKSFLNYCEKKSKNELPIFYIEDVKKIIRLTGEDYNPRKVVIPKWIIIKEYAMENLIKKIKEKYSK